MRERGTVTPKTRCEHSILSSLYVLVLDPDSTVQFSTFPHFRKNTSTPRFLDLRQTFSVFDCLNYRRCGDAVYATCLNSFSPVVEVDTNFRAKSFSRSTNTLLRPV